MKDYTAKPAMGFPTEVWQHFQKNKTITFGLYLQLLRNKKPLTQSKFVNSTQDTN